MERSVRRTSLIEIDLEAIARNLRLVRGACGGGVGVCAVVKSDAYGLGAGAVAGRLDQAGVDMLAVCSLDEAAALLEAGVGARTGVPILVLMPVTGGDLRASGQRLRRALTEGRLHLSAHTASQAVGLRESASAMGVKLPVHVEVDTGMSRGGSEAREASKIVAVVNEDPWLRLAGVYTHLASADRDGAQTSAQHEAFSRWLEAHRAAMDRACVTHEANTFGAFRSASSHRRMVRVGLALLGWAIEEARDPERWELASAARELEPCLRWTTRLIQTKWIDEGTPVGYGATWRAARRTRLGLAPVGYADGYPWSLGSRGTVRVQASDGRLVDAPVVGAVSMDQITIDLTELGEAEAGVGALVELIGRDRGATTDLARVARAAGTISHELLCRLSPQIERRLRSAAGKPASLAAQNS